MKPRTLLILLVMVAGLGSFIWFYERKLPSSEERAEQAKKVLSLKKEDLTAVTLVSGIGEVRLERIPAPEDKKDGKQSKDEKDEQGEQGDEAEETPPVEWMITKPLRTRADTFAVDRLLDALLSLEKTRTLEDAKPQDLGLDKPQATVRLATKEGETVLKLGAAVPTGAAVIAGLEGAGLEGEAYVVSDTILAEIQKPPGDWREHAIFHGDREAIQRLTLTGAPGGPVVLVRRPQGFWIEKPISDRADRELVDTLLSDLAALTAEQFLDGRAPAELGLVPPQAVLDVASKPGTPPVRIELGAPVSSEPLTSEGAEAGAASGELSYGRAGNALFEAQTPLTASIRRAPADWRAKQLSAFEVYQIESATVVGDSKEPLRLTRAGTDWKRGDTTISYVPVSDLFFAVTGASADRLLTPQEAQALQASLAKPVLTFDFETKDAGKEILNLYPALPTGVPARASGRPTILLLPADTLRQVQEKLQAVKTAKQVTAEAESEEKE